MGFEQRHFALCICVVTCRIALASGACLLTYGKTPGHFNWDLQVIHVVLCTIIVRLYEIRGYLQGLDSY